MLREETSESALDDLKVRNIVQEVGRPWSIWVTAPRRGCMFIGPIRMSSAIAAVLSALDGNHIMNTVGRRIAVLAGAHL